MFKLRSVRSIVIAPANTGKDRSNSTAVTKTAQQKRGIRSSFMPYARKFIIVVIKLTAPRMEEIPAKWREKMLKSTDKPL